jgi:hypothetical protein
MSVHETELAERAIAERLLEIEKSLAHSRDVIAQINEVLRYAANLRRVGADDSRH